MKQTLEGGCHCGSVRFRANLDLDQASTCSCSICTKKGIVHLPVYPADFQLLQGRDALTVYVFGTGVAQHPFCARCGMAPFYVPRSNPDRLSVNARCLDGIDASALSAKGFFDGRDWDAAQRAKLAAGGVAAPAGTQGADTLRRVLDAALG